MQTTLRSQIKTLLIVALPLFFLISIPCEAQKFAIIGDYGVNKRSAKKVSKLVKSWTPEFIITLGDNNYYRGRQRTIDTNIGRLYSCYIHPYKGYHGKGADTLRFFPSIGNHDVMIDSGKSYFDYFELPGNERYYDFVWGAVHFFVVNSDRTEPHGNTETSKQAQWLKQQLSTSTATWKIVYFHHAPYASLLGEGSTWMRWPFKEWGASAVLAGHEHHYERINRDGLLYIINGLGGAKIRPAEHITKGSEIQYFATHGAMRAHATPQKLQFEFININNELIDTVTLSKP